MRKKIKKSAVHKAQAENNQLDYNTENAVMSILADFKVHTRQELINWTGKPDREIRLSISNLRCMGKRILSDSGNKGYRLAKTEEEYRNSAFRRQQINRIKSIIEQIKSMDKGEEHERITSDTSGVESTKGAIQLIWKV